MIQNTLTVKIVRADILTICVSVCFLAERFLLTHFWHARFAVLAAVSLRFYGGKPAQDTASNSTRSSSAHYETSSLIISSCCYQTAVLSTTNETSSCCYQTAVLSTTNETSSCCYQTAVLSRTNETSSCCYQTAVLSTTNETSSCCYQTAVPDRVDSSAVCRRYVLLRTRRLQGLLNKPQFQHLWAGGGGELQQRKLCLTRAADLH